jgi:hypothetical protein
VSSKKIFYVLADAAIKSATNKQIVVIEIRLMSADTNSLKPLSSWYVLIVQKSEITETPAPAQISKIKRVLMLLISVSLKKSSDM